MSSWSLWHYSSPSPLGWVGPPDLHGFYKWGFDSLDILNDFTGQGRREAGMRKWTDWLREDLGSRAYAWLRPDFVLPSPFLVVKDPFAEASGILVEPHLIGAEFCKGWILFFCPSGHLVVTVDQFWGIVGHLLPQESQLDLPWITERDLQEVAGANKSTAPLVLRFGYSAGAG